MLINTDGRLATMRNGFRVLTDSDGFPFLETVIRSLTHIICLLFIYVTTSVANKRTPILMLGGLRLSFPIRRNASIFSFQFKN